MAHNTLQRGFKLGRLGAVFTLTPMFKGHSLLSEKNYSNSVEEPGANILGILLIDSCYGLKFKFN